MQVLTSLHQLAEALKLSMPAVARHVKRPLWPYGQRGPWPARQVPLMQAWIAANVPTDNRIDTSEGSEAAGAQGPKQRSLKDTKTAVETQILMVDLIERAGKVHDAGKCKERRVAQFLELKTRLLGLESSVPHRAGLVGDEASKLGALVREEVEGVLRQISEPEMTKPQ